MAAFAFAFAEAVLVSYEYAVGRRSLKTEDNQASFFPSTVRSFSPFEHVYSREKDQTERLSDK